jgi:adenylate cyclase
VAHEQRRLAAIVAIDVVGYSRLMGQNESGTHALLKTHLTERVMPSFGRHGGRVVKSTGDGVLAEFGSTVGALSALIELQQAMATANRDEPETDRIVFRSGVHLGEVIVEDNDLYGDAVNIAARLQGEAPPGGILISRAVREAVEGRLKAKLHALGELSLKNIERPIRAFRVEWDAADWMTQAKAPQRALSVEPTGPALTLPDKPSIAVLPFQNMSGDPEQEYFVDGLVEDVITSLSRNKQLFVIARNSSFTYKGKSPDVRQVGRELGVRYVLEGSVRKSGNRVRIAGQLIDASNGGHIWADRFDGNLDDIFELQDQIASSVVGGIFIPLLNAEMERSKRKVGNIQAYDYTLRSRALRRRFTAEANTEAFALAREAIALDPDFALGHALIADLYTQRWSFGWAVDRAAEAVDAERAARRALELDSNDPEVLASCGQVLVMVLGRLQEGAAYLDKAVRIDPNFSWGLTYRSAARIALGEPEEAISDLERALRLSPIDPTRSYALTLLARAQALCGRYDKALLLVADSLRLRPNFPPALIDSTVAHALAGHLDSARQSLVAYEKFLPGLRIATFREQSRYLSTEGREKYVEALRIVGVPE